MAWTVAVIDKFNVANKRCHVLSCTADATTQTVDTGLDVVDHFQITGQSAATAACVAYKNTGAEGTSIAGKIGFSNIVSGDVFFCYAYGR